LNSIMMEEASSAAACVQQQLCHDEERYAALGAWLRQSRPRYGLTVARGSSDHAASYLAYLAMWRAGCVVASLPMSLVTLYDAALDVRGILTVAVSQSGQSPDVVMPLRGFRDKGATTVALVNDPDAPLAHAVEWVLPLRAGVERSVAATKSYVASLVAAARLVSCWTEDAALADALCALPQALHDAATVDWSAALPEFAGAQRAMVIGRGPCMTLAQEAALKFKETSFLQAEAISSAELRHGPLALVEPGYPMLILAAEGPALAQQLRLAEDLRAMGAHVVLAAPADVRSRQLTMPRAPAPELAPITAAIAIYRMAAELAALRGLDPDRPRHLRKVTLTH
jgi:glutamine---fructose-6-phosphate transaminase (isomerizing)